MALIPRARKRVLPLLPLTALMDIIFLLLIYFLLTTNFLAEEGIDIRLPEAKAGAVQQTEPLTLWVDRDGEVYLKNNRIDQKVLFEHLRTILADSDRLVVIKADRAVILKQAVRVMDIAKAAGARRLALATESTF